MRFGKSLQLFELRRHIVVLGPIFGGNLILGVAWMISRSPTAEFLYALYNMFVWVGLAGYAFFWLYSFYFLGRDQLLHISDISRERVLATKAFVLAGMLYVYFLGDIVMSLPSISRSSHDSISVIVMYYLVAKAASLLCFFSLCALVVVVVKFFRSKTWALLVAGCMFAAVTILGAVAIWHQGYRPDLQWSIGITSDYNVVNQYVNIVPIMIGPARPGLLDSSINYFPVALNLVLAATSAFGAHFFITRTRADFTGR